VRPHPFEHLLWKEGAYSLHKEEDEDASSALCETVVQQLYEEGSVFSHDERLERHQDF